MNPNARTSTSCDHCGSTIRPVERGDALAVRVSRAAYACDKCHCSWDSRMNLVRKGPYCPVYGREDLRSAVNRIVQWLLEQGDAQPVSARP